MSQTPNVKTFKGMQIVKLKDCAVGKYYLATVPYNHPESNHVLYLKLKSSMRSHPVIAVVSMDTILLIANDNSMDNVSERTFDEIFHLITKLHCSEVLITPSAAKSMKGYSNYSLPVW